MPAQKTDKRNTLYANLMDEVKVRIDCISTTCQGRGAYPTVITREFCYLQLRMLCELIALSCLVAHGDIVSLQSHKTGKAYSADDMLERLEKLRPHFYPLAIRQKKIDGPPSHFEIDVVEPSPLPKQELLSLYGLTHRYVHRGSLKKLLSSDAPIDTHVDIPEIIRWTQKVHDLLAHQLRNADDNNKVQVATAEAGPTLSTGQAPASSA